MKDIKVKSTIAEVLKVPKDVSEGAMILTLIGNKELLIENYKGIIDYSCREIRLQGKHNQVLIQGAKLCIEYYTNEDMKISGIIKQISYL